MFEDGRIASDVRAFVPIERQPFTFAYYTLIVIDLNAALDSRVWTQLKASLQSFIQSKVQNKANTFISIATFDGSATLSSVIDYSNDVTALNNAVNGYTPTKSDPSTDLYSNVMNGFDSLKSQTKSLTSSIAAFHSMILITQTADLAARKTSNDALNAGHNSNAFIFTIGLGSTAPTDFLTSLGTSGAVAIIDPNDLSTIVIIESLIESIICVVI